MQLTTLRVWLSADGAFQVDANSGQTIAATCSHMTINSGSGKISAITSNLITSTTNAASALTSIIDSLNTFSLGCFEYGRSHQSASVCG